MTNQTFPITPPTELLQQWHEECHKVHKPFLVHIANQSSQWGADQELEACCEWMRERGLHPEYLRDLRLARRPKPPSFKEQKLAELEAILTERNGEDEWFAASVRQLLEALPND